MSKRIVFTTATPNDQGGVIPNDTLDFSRFNRNPVVLCQHVWGNPPIGLMTDVKYDKDADEWSGVPVFHELSDESKLYSKLYEGGWIKACSIGGDCEWKTNSAGQLQYDDKGNKIAEKFMLYEISIVTLPSNPDAVTKEQLAAKIYGKDELTTVHDSIVTLSSTYKNSSMKPEETKTPEDLAIEAAEKQLADAKAKKEAVKAGANGGAGNNSNDPSISQLPAVVKEIVKHNESMFDKFMTVLGLKAKEPVKAATAPAPKDEPESKISDPTTPQPTPTGLTAEQEAAKKKAEESRQSAEKAVNEAASAKEKAEKEGASQEDKDEYAAKCAAAEKACNDALEAEAAYKSSMESEDMKTKNTAGAGKGDDTRGKTPVAPKLKTVEQLKSEAATLAPKPEIRAKVVAMAGTTFSKLTAKGNAEGERIVNRVLTSDSGEKNIADYAILLESLLADGRYKAITDKVRMIVTTNGQFQSYQQQRNVDQVRNRAGMSLQQLAAKLQRGSVEVLGRDGILREMTTLNSTDNALAAPALTTIEWLSLAIFTLYPSSDWKSDIPMFGAQMTSANTGLIWANVAADPTVYFGTQPVNPANYSTNDTAVSITLIPSWLQPMLWTPLTMHQLRYDQMAVQWAQAFAKWGALIDDKLIFTLASAVPAASTVFSIGQTGAGGTVNFALSGANDPNAFYYNPTLQTSLAAPAWADIIRIEQIFAKQNYDLDRERVVLIVDPTMERYIATDPDTKSLLTRFTQSNPEDVLKIKHTRLVNRSRIAVYDPATSQIKDPAGAIPAGAVSASLAFLPSQAALALGILDVFVVQDPTNYGYKMSADIREGAQWVRSNVNGGGVYTYGPAVNAPANV